MDADYSKLLYVNDNIQTKDKIFVSSNYYGTVFFLLNNQLFNLNLEEMDKYYNKYKKLIIYCINIKYYNYKNNYIKFNKVLELYKNINYDETLNTKYEKILNKKYDLKTIITLSLTEICNFDYINNIILSFNLENIYLIITIYNNYDLSKLYLNNLNYCILNINKNNHIAGFLCSLNYINNNPYLLNYNYIFKLYYHENNNVNNEILKLDKNTIINKNIIGYPNIKFDYLDSYYLFEIIKEYYNIIDFISKKDSKDSKDLLKNIKFFYNMGIDKQINRKSKEFQLIIKNTNISYIPTSIFIAKLDLFNNYYFIIDLYSKLEDNLIYDYNKQSFSNGLNKFINIFLNLN